MTLAHSLLKQTAVYWPPLGTSNSGQRTYDTPQEIKCRWENEAVQFLDANGEEATSQSVVDVKVDLVIGGVLLLGNVEDNVVDGTAPLQHTGAHEIRQFSKVPNTRATRYWRTAYL